MFLRLPKVPQVSELSWAPGCDDRTFAASRVGHLLSPCIELTLVVGRLYICFYLQSVVDVGSYALTTNVVSTFICFVASL